MHNLLTKIREYITFLSGSYSQEGEDAVLARFFDNKRSGFYIDVGAHHPTRFSNTYAFYKKGWKGINIDATPGSMKLFNKYRRRDINIENPISNSSKPINYYIFDEPALNSFSESLSKDRDANTKYKIKKIIKLIPKRLSDVLDKNILKKTSIDFMSIDVEGYEYQVLSSNNWNKYRPKYILVEILNRLRDDVSKDKVFLYLKSKNYDMVGKIGRNVIFKKNK